MRCIAMTLLLSAVLPAALSQHVLEPRDKLDNKVEEIQQLMQEIRATRDPHRREELLRRHEQALQEAMGIVDQSGRGDLDRSMEERMQGLEDRTQTRQEMLEQMIEHQAQELETEPYRYTPQDDTDPP